MQPPHRHHRSVSSSFRSSLIDRLRLPRSVQDCPRYTPHALDRGITRHSYPAKNPAKMIKLQCTANSLFPLRNTTIRHLDIMIRLRQCKSLSIKDADPPLSSSIDSSSIVDSPSSLQPAARQLLDHRYL